MKPNQITNVPDFLKLLWKEHDRAFLFRGQPQSWPLVPSIARWSPDNSGYESWRTFQESLLEEYIKYGSQHLRKKPNDKIEWLIHAQHHGVPTCLLDFSTSPLKALYFAVSQEEHDSIDGAFWSVAPKTHLEDHVSNRSFAFKTLEFYLPRQTNHRLIAQQGGFAVFPLSKTTKALAPMDEDAAYSKAVESIQRWIIPAKNKNKIRTQLALLGIRPRTMYPDLEGVVAEIKRELKLGGHIP